MVTSFHADKEVTTASYRDDEVTSHYGDVVALTRMEMSLMVVVVVVASYVAGLS